MDLTLWDFFVLVVDPLVEVVAVVVVVVVVVVAVVEPLLAVVDVMFGKVLLPVSMEVAR